MEIDFTKTLGIPYDERDPRKFLMKLENVIVDMRGEIKELREEIIRLKKVCKSLRTPTRYK